MRHTFGTWLSKGGVAPRTAQSAMRHSNIDLTMQVYTDPKLLDVLGAIDSLPQLPLVDNTEVMVQASMGTDDVPSQRHGPKFAPGFALNPHNRGQSIATQDKCSELDDSIQESKKARNQCDLQDFSQSGRLDLNQRPLRPERKGTQSQGAESQKVTATSDSRCTNGCTSDSNLYKIAADLKAALTSDECRRVAELLTQSEGSP